MTCVRFQRSDTVIREERTKERRVRAEPQDAPADCRRGEQERIKNIKE